MPYNGVYPDRQPGQETQSVNAPDKLMRRPKQGQLLNFFATTTACACGNLAALGASRHGAMDVSVRGSGGDRSCELKSPYRLMPLDIEVFLTKFLTQLTGGIVFMYRSRIPVPEERAAPRKAGAAQIAKAIFFSFFGVRKRRDYEVDAAKITLLQAIVGGLIGVAILIAALLLLVTVVTR